METKGTGKESVSQNSREMDLHRRGDLLEVGLGDLFPDWEAVMSQKFEKVWRKLSFETSLPPENIFDLNSSSSMADWVPSPPEETQAGSSLYSLSSSNRTSCTETQNPLEKVQSAQGSPYKLGIWPPSLENEVIFEAPVDEEGSNMLESSVRFDLRDKTPPWTTKSSGSKFKEPNETNSNGVPAQETPIIEVQKTKENKAQREGNNQGEIIQLMKEKMKKMSEKAKQIRADCQEIQKCIGGLPKNQTKRGIGSFKRIEEFKENYWKHSREADLQC